MAIEEKKGFTRSEVMELAKNIEKQLLLIQKLSASELNVKAAQVLKACLSTLETRVLAIPVNAAVEPEAASMAYKNQLHLFRSYTASSEKVDMESSSSLNPEM
ncbi:MAG: hypothetical protein CK426_00850 [Legionella sp.]|nr:MAG: hypothetical protein CK423_02140 [Legionella sp.]PJE00088.1 MAG: hypothetical protein CK426_00850 [Legionella sp.]